MNWFMVFLAVVSAVVWLDLLRLFIRWAVRQYQELWKRRRALERALAGLATMLGSETARRMRAERKADEAVAAANDHITRAEVVVNEAEAAVLLLEKLIYAEQSKSDTEKTAAGLVRLVQALAKSGQLTELMEQVKKAQAAGSKSPEAETKQPDAELEKSMQNLDT